MAMRREQRTFEIQIADNCRHRKATVWPTTLFARWLVALCTIKMIQSFEIDLHLEHGNKSNLVCAARVNAHVIFHHRHSPANK